MKTVDVILHNDDAYVVMPTMSAGSIDLIVTSPRYNVGMDYGTVSDRTDWPTYYSEIRLLLEQAYRLLVDGGVLAINLPKEVRLHKEEIDGLGRRVEKIAMRVDLMCEEIGFLPREAIVWVKSSEANGPMATTYRMGADNNIYIRPTCEMILLHSKGRYWYDNGSGRRGKTDVPFLDETKDVWWNISPRDQHHPATFPIEIPDRLIRMFTNARNERRVPVIFDPFMGTGTSGVAAIQNGRDFIGCEIDPAYFSQARSRIYGTTARLFDQPLEEQGDEP
jgi:DNA modification methylase